MSKSTHTPGPWTQFENGANIGTSDGYAICDMALGYSSLPNEELEANAHLIAAAPDLLEQAEVLVEKLKSMAIHESHYAPLEAVIAKATRGSA